MSVKATRLGGKKKRIKIILVLETQLSTFLPLAEFNKALSGPSAAESHTSPKQATSGRRHSGKALLKPGLEKNVCSCKAESQTGLAEAPNNPPPELRGFFSEAHPLT